MTIRVLPILSVAAALFGTIAATAQKKELDHDVYDSWQKVSNVTISDNGEILVWQVDPQEGDGELFVRNMGALPKSAKAKKGVTREISVPRGYSASLDSEGRWLYCRIKPEFAKSRKEKIDKTKKEDIAKDTLAVVDLKTMTLKKYGIVESFTTGFRSKPYVAYKSSWKETAEKDSAKAKKNPEWKSGLVILNPANGHADSLKNVDSYTFDNQSRFLALTTKKDKKDSLSATAVIIASLTQDKLVLDTLAKGAEAYRKTVFNDSGTEMLFMASTDTSKARNKEYSLSIVEINYPKVHEAYAFSVKELFAQGTEVEGTNGWTLNENSDLFFTPDGKRVFTGIAPIIPPKDTNIVDFETAQLDIWSWDAPYTPPQQKVNLTNTLKKTYSAVINLDGSRGIVPLTTSFSGSVRILGAGKTDWAVCMDDGKYVRSSVWDYAGKTDVELVNLNDGSRKKVAEGLSAGRFDVSPEGNYLLWFDNNDLNWHTYNVETGAVANLTAATGIQFYDEENDKPTFPEAHERSPRWVAGEKAVLIIDRYDVWKFATDGSSAVNLTKGLGRETHHRFRTMNVNPFPLTYNESRSGVKQSLGEKDILRLSVQNEDNKRNGFGRLSLANPKDLSYFTDTVSFDSVTKALKSDRIAFLKGDFRHPYDLNVTDNWFGKDSQVTSINPQMSEYRWGRSELFEWSAYDGTPLKGLVFIPDGIKPGEKLPVMVYFYEKYSDQLYNFWTPAPSRSIINVSFYTSRGYIVFIPDIVYKVGHPGESAWNCICSGAEALCEKYPFANKSKMAIQGQSWGGYQTAYLVTRTNLFAAAGSGAPVGNMTSAYGGIRWGSGITRAGQYEHGQSRIGKTMWEEGGLELYIENSPVFHADKVQTPILIMHNDNDGAVPWYQGIEFFSNLRRLDKPCWLLEYNKEAHNLVERRNCKDLSVRLQQFFDYYLKDGPLPAWMKTGVSTDKKSEYSGFENAE